MRWLSRLVLLTIISGSPFAGTGAGRAAEPPVNIIFDTDMGGDCDDVGALFILHGAVERGEARLLATMGCISADTIAPCLDAINTWFGRPEIPVGTRKTPDSSSAPITPRKSPNGFRISSRSGRITRMR